ncbi:MAG: anthranilate phosphoribosyltransferase [Candidatus Bipolaricaulota bacterium]|nr:anthranilate phosphoribosyltransferase [Candidatus Bipolaricaulota bacterium]
MTQIKEAIEHVTDRKDLNPDLAQGAMDELMSGESSETNIGALLAGLKSKGVSVEEIAAFANVMRKKSIKINPELDEDLVDMCGTGGSTVKTFNISTISAFVVAGAGFSVAKHGNRSNTSQSGSADLLEALGVDLDAKPEQVKKAIEEVGIGFLYAPNLHPAMKHAAKPRKDLGIRTVFNILGPLTNPASASRQLLGVYDRELVEKFPSVLDKLGVSRALVVHGLAGIDEISTLGETYVGELTNGKINHYTVHPRDFGLPVADPENIGDLSPAASAGLAIGIMTGEIDGPPRDIVLLNAGAGIYVAGGGNSLREGLELARQSIDSGEAYRKARKLVKETGTLDDLIEVEKTLPQEVPL